MRSIPRFLALGALLLALGAVPAQAQEQEIPLGSLLPMQDVVVQHVNGTTSTIGALTGSAGTVFVFWSNQCVWVDKYEDRVLALFKEFAGKNVGFVLINANDPAAFPQEAASVGQEKNYPVPYVVDAGAQFAQGVGASRTPHVFAFNADKALVYVGTLDDSPGDPSNVKKTYLRDVLVALTGGGAIDVPKTKAFGCRIKF